MGEAPFCSMHQRYLRGGKCIDCTRIEDQLTAAIVALRDIAKGLHMIESRQVAQKALDIIDGKQ